MMYNTVARSAHLVNTRERSSTVRFHFHFPRELRVPSSGRRPPPSHPAPYPLYGLLRSSCPSRFPRYPHPTLPHRILAAPKWRFNPHRPPPLGLDCRLLLSSSPSEQAPFSLYVYSSNLQLVTSSKCFVHHNPWIKLLG